MAQRWWFWPCVCASREGDLTAMVQRWYGSGHGLAATERLGGEDNKFSSSFTILFILSKRTRGIHQKKSSSTEGQEGAAILYLSNVNLYRNKQVFRRHQASICTCHVINVRRHTIFLSSCLFSSSHFMCFLQSAMTWVSLVWSPSQHCSRSWKKTKLSRIQSLSFST
jgi:hypothetical protein